MDRRSVRRTQSQLYPTSTKGFPFVGIEATFARLDEPNAGTQFTFTRSVVPGWSPADGKSKPALSHEEFAAKMREWIVNGAAIPE